MDRQTVRVPTVCEKELCCGRRRVLAIKKGSTAKVCLLLALILGKTLVKFWVKKS